ncbi:MAG: T9SS type A sorting domain-containing protein [Chitinophagaceae bacterium]|nr:T9SS type A sorting domain-containing protein [Chitinophagaceae bacterium]
MSNPTPTGYYEEDEGFVNQLPIGFSFVFDNKSYTHININVNGFASFGTPFMMNVQEKYSANNLTNGLKNDGVRPIIAPLWDDLWLVDTFSLKYKIAGAAPNRTFTVEWNNVQWNYNNYTDTAIAFQMVLFETSNKIQFIYKPLPGKISNANASIGIATCSNCVNSFLSVQSFDENAGISGIKEFNAINEKPKGVMGFEFAPSKLGMPEAFMVNSYNTNKVTFSWNSISVGSYDYAVTKSELQPDNFNTTSTKSATVENLEAGTQYFIHLRTSNNIFEKSGWLTIPFKTAFTTAIPYKENFEKTPLFEVPFNQVAINPIGGTAWSNVSTINAQLQNKAIAVTSNNTTTSDAWLTLPSMQFEAGISYRLKFSFKTNDTTKGVQKFEVRIGKLLSTGMIGWQLVHRNLKVNQVKFKDTSFLFAAPTNDEYFVAFRSISDNNNAALIIDEIEVDKVKPLPAKIVFFRGERKDEYTNNIIWRTSAELRTKTFELQRSADNKNFVSIDAIGTKAINGTSSSILDYAIQDNKPNTIDYYRLRIIDEDGNDFFSNTIKVQGKLAKSIDFSRMYPNPATNIVTAVIYSSYNARAKYQIFDSYGKLMLDIPVTISIGDNLIKADISKLNRGIYYSKLVCIIGETSEPKMFIKQ